MEKIRNIQIKTGGKDINGKKKGRKMKIKVHNSLAKTNLRSEFIFNELIYFVVENSIIRLSHNIQDYGEFLSFNVITKELLPAKGFGKNLKFTLSTWWKRTGIIWSEIMEEEQNENQTTQLLG